MTESDIGWVGVLVPVCILYIYWVFSYELCVFLPIADTVKYRKSQFYATNHKSHQNAMYLTDYSSFNYPGLAEIPAPVWSQWVAATPTNARSLVNICLGAGRVLQSVQDGSHLINVMICIDINRVGGVTRACMLGGMHFQKRLRLSSPFPASSNKEF